MANYNATNRTKLDAGTKDGNWIDQGLIKSGIKVMSDAFDGTCEDGLTVGIATPPVGAVIHLIAISQSGLGASCTMELGDEDSFGRYISGIDVSVASQVCEIFETGSQYVIGTTDGDDQMLFQINGGDGTGVVKIAIFYTN